MRDIGLYGEDFVLYRDAEGLRRQHRKFKEARAAYLEVLTRFPQGPYADASQLYAALCFVETDKIPDAERELTALRQANPYGPYSGEAILELGRIALEHHLNPGAARGCFLLLDTWIQEVKAKPVLNITKLAVPTAALKVTAPPQDEKYKDLWGNVKESEIKPGMLVNPKTCPWYLDDLAEQSAMYQGFLFSADGKKEEALAAYKRILDCDPATRRLETQGEWNDYTRLKFGAQHGYLIANPKELNLYDERQKLAVSLGDFHYVIQDFEHAAAIFTDLLNNKHGALTPEQREYPLYALGHCVYRGHWQAGGGHSLKEAFAVWEKVLVRKSGSCREYQTAYTMANLSHYTNDPALRKRGRELLMDLAKAKADNDFTRKARICLAMDMAAEGRKDEATAILGLFKEADGDYYAMAQHLIKNGGQLIAPAPKANR